MSESQGDNVPICFIVQLVEHCKGTICFIAQLVEHCKGNDVRKPGSRQCSNLLHSSVGETLRGK